MAFSYGWRAVALPAILAFTMNVHAQSVMNNAEIITLLEAGLSEQIILQAIGSAKAHKFDTSAKALVLLKNKGASEAVIKAILNPTSAATSAAPAARSAPTSASGRPAAPKSSSDAAQGLNPEELLVVIDGNEETMKYIIPTMRTAVRALGFGGAAMYATLNGVRAERRLPRAGFEFIVSVPKNAQPQGYITLANFAIRNNGTREVATGSGYMSFSTGITRDRVIPIKHEALADQSRSREGFTLYKVIPQQELTAGEYALVFYTAEVRVAGFFSHASNSFFDFGVD